ncbi:JmjC domain-containing protein [Niveibacterium sp. 24ML]|uniref:JmjC domain-containing protein n=1 Tax=Niveibacterium sp. 24ML TaxID=2985512 RepID=UPI002B4C11D6|nr:cupin domain-containing protein [Niveibacterium sp. 24ML]
MLDLAQSDEMESRMVWQTDGQWELEHGPFTPKAWRRKGPWTALVSGTNLVSNEADALLREFNFIPYARLDDLMVSFATDGGGVGPHFDNYDVFLIQGMGRRRWRISAQRDLTVIDGAPLRLLKHFKPSKEWIVEPGDLLYLPPQYAHDGVAIGDCMTYSVGFRTATAQELADGFLTYLQENLCLRGRYADPNLERPRNPAEISDDMVEQVAQMLHGITWNKKTVANFLGAYLSEPKSHVFFEPPARPLAPAAFERLIRANGFRLDLKTQLLFKGHCFYLNGEPFETTSAQRAAFRDIAKNRSISANAVNPAVIDAFYDWYCSGFGHPGAFA